MCATNWKEEREGCVWGACLSDFLLLGAEPGGQGCPTRVLPAGLAEAGGLSNMGDGQASRMTQPLSTEVLVTFLHQLVPPGWPEFGPRQQFL